MKDFGSDVTKAFRILCLAALAFTIVVLLPLLTPFLMAIPFFWFGFTQLKLYKSSKSWPRVTGRLIKTGLGTYGVAESKYRYETYYFPLAHFSYSFNNCDYTSNQYCLDRKSIWNSNQAEVNDVIKAIEASASLDAFVNPDSPKTAVLNISVSRSRISHAYGLIGSGIVISLVGIFMLMNYDKFVV